jgi:hypothetical protein
MMVLYTAGALLVLAQVIGLYGLKTRKADVVFTLVMAALVVAAVALGAYEVFHLRHY